MAQDNAPQQPPTTYINGIVIREFGGGGQYEPRLSVGINLDEFTQECAKHLNDRGWVNLVIGRRRTQSDKGVTHYVRLDTYKPKSQQPQEQQGGGDDIP